MACGTCVVSLPVFACLLPALLPCSLLKVFSSPPHSSLVDGLTTINFLALPKFTAPKLIDPHRCSSLPLSPAPLSCSSQFFNFPHRRCESFPESFLIVRWLDGAFLGTPQTDRPTQVQLFLSLAIPNSSIFQIVAVIRSQNHSARLPATLFTAVRRWLSDVAAAGSAHLGGLTFPHCAMA